MDSYYIAVDLKSFYASVECVDLGLDPLATHLVVADPTRTEKTICLAVTPTLKAYGISGRARLFEVVQRVKEVNGMRREAAPRREFTGTSHFQNQLEQNPSLKLDYLVMPPRMARYLEVSNGIYQIYLKYVAKEDILVYSVDEVFMDVTHYLKTYQMTPEELAEKIVMEIMEKTGIAATAGIGTNMYLAKIAMDIWAKHQKPDPGKVRMASLNEKTYRKYLWSHEPLSDFWRVGRKTQEKLNQIGIQTMGDIARCSLGGPNEYYNEDLLFRMFGVNAELLIDHAWGIEPCQMKDVKAYKPKSSSLSHGQVLKEPYNAEKTRLIVKEMTDVLSLELVEKNLITDQLVLTIGYDIENMYGNGKKGYGGATQMDHYGRKIPKHAHGTIHMDHPTSAATAMVEKILELFDRIMDSKLTARRINITADHVREREETGFHQITLFETQEEEQRQREQKENQLQKAMLEIKKKYGSNAVLKGMNLEEGGTTRERNEQIGGHRA